MEDGAGDGHGAQLSVIGQAWRACRGSRRLLRRSDQAVMAMNYGDHEPAENRPASRTELISAA
jgi:hypothetical protein